MNEEISTLPVSIIRQHCFCPRIPVFLEIYKLHPATPLWVKEGLSYHEKREKLSKYKPFKTIFSEKNNIKFSQYLKSEKYRIHGIIDCLILKQDEIIPVEFKIKFNSSNKGSIIQLCAYSLIITEQYKQNINYGYIISEKYAKISNIIFSNEIQKQTLKKIDEVFQNLNSGLLPHSSATEAQCSQCEYINYCNDRF